MAETIELSKFLWSDDGNYHSESHDSLELGESFLLDRGSSSFDRLNSNWFDLGYSARGFQIIEVTPLVPAPQNRVMRDGLVFVDERATPSDKVPAKRLQEYMDATWMKSRARVTLASSSR